MKYPYYGMKYPTVEELFGTLTKPPKQENPFEEAIRMAKELTEKLEKIKK